MSEWQGKNSVCDKMTSCEICAKYNLPYGFDGPMFPLGLHIDSYNPRRQDPVHYGGTKKCCLRLQNF